MLLKVFLINQLNASVALIETSQLICCANQLTSFYIRATLAFNGLIFGGITRHRYFTKCTLIVIKSIVKIIYIDSYTLFRTSAIVEFINSKMGVAICNSFMNILLIPISVFKLTCPLNILTYKLGNIYRYIGHF